MGVGSARCLLQDFFSSGQPTYCFVDKAQSGFVVLKRVCCAKDLPECFKLKCVSEAPWPTTESVW